MTRTHRGTPRARWAPLIVAMAVAVVAGCGSATPKADRPTSQAAAGPVTVGPASGPPVGPAPAAGPGGDGGPWGEGLHDAAHSSSTSVVGPASGALAWTAHLGAPLIDGPVVAADGTVYQSADDGTLHALDGATGRAEWVYRAGAPFDDPDLSISPAVLGDGTVLWPAPGAALDALSPEGRLLWSIHLSGRVLSPTVTASGQAYVTDSTGDLVGLRPSAGGPGERWSIRVGTTSYSSPAVAPGGTVYTTAGDDLVAVSAPSGHPRIDWRFAAGAAIEVSPAVAPDGTVLLGTNDPYEYGIAPTGTVRWRYRRPGFSYSSPAVSADGLGYFGDNSGNVDVVRAADGTVVGRYATTTRPLSPNGVGVWTAPLVDGRHDVYFGTVSGHVFGFSYSGRPLFDLDTGAAVTAYPALNAGGTLLVGSANGTLYALRTPGP